MAQRRRARLDLVVDVALSAVALAVGLLRDASRIPGWFQSSAQAPPPPYLLHPSPAVIVGAHVVGAVVLLGRRRWPLVVAGVLAALSLVVPLVSAVLATYAVARWAGPLRTTLAVNASVVLGVLVGGDLLRQFGSTDWRFGDPYTVVLSVAALTATGLYLKARAELEESERRHERVRLAVALHDDVSRHLTEVTMGAAALSVDAPDAATREEAERLRASGEQGLSALHRMIRGFTDGAAELGSALGAGSRSGPVSVSSRREILLAAVAEGLHNADKHAPGAPVTVTVRNGETSQPGSAPGGSGDLSGSGLGLRAATERVRGIGGSVTSGPDGQGGWTLTVEAP